VSKLPATQERKKRARSEQEGDPPAPERAVRRRMGDTDGLAQIHPPGNEQIHHPAQGLGFELVSLPGRSQPQWLSESEYLKGTPPDTAEPSGKSPRLTR